MSIFKNLSNQEKKKVLSLCKKTPYKPTDHVATELHWVVWDHEATDDYCAENGYQPISKVIEGCENWELVENPYSKEECLQVVKIAKLGNNNINPIKFSDSVFNAELVALGYSFMNPKNKIVVRKKLREYYDNGSIKRIGALYITDGEINFMLMPIAGDPTSIDPKAISAADVEMARKYKLHLSKSHDLPHIAKTEKNIIIMQGDYFVTFPRENAFLNEVFDIREVETTNLELEIDESKTKHTEDLFHKKVAYAKAVQGYGRDGEFYHLYENGTGVCFKAE